MKITGQSSVGAGQPVRAAAPARPAGRAAAVAGPAPVQDTTSVLGIPEAEFTPKVRAAIMVLLQEVDSLRGELEQSKSRIAHLEKLADQDALTPVSNRRAFVRELSRMLSFAQRYDSPVSVLYFDVNGLKQINDTYGHAAGDAAITHVAAALTGHVRESDVVGRLGGDEFGVILANASEEAARRKAEQLAGAIASQPADFKGQQIAVRVTFGAYAVQGSDDAHAMLEQADRAMYAAKPGEKAGSS